MCRSRRELSNAYLLAKIGVDTAENETLEVWGEKFNPLLIRLLGQGALVRVARLVRAARGPGALVRGGDLPRGAPNGFPLGYFLPDYICES